MYGIIDAPDHATMVGASVAINASGAVVIKTTVLMTPEEVDQAVKKAVRTRRRDGDDDNDNAGLKDCRMAGFN